LQTAALSGQKEETWCHFWAGPPCHFGMIECFFWVKFLNLLSQQDPNKALQPHPDPEVLLTKDSTYIMKSKNKYDF